MENSTISNHHQNNDVTYIALKVARFSSKKESSIVRNLDMQEVTEGKKNIYEHN